MLVQQMLRFTLTVCCAVVLGCGEDVCVDGTCPRDGGAGGQYDAQADACPGSSSGVAACDECRAANCCMETAACVTKPRCSAWLACVNDCGGDPLCRADCFATHTAADEKAALAACEARSCAAECGLGQCGGFVFTSTNDECAACAQQNCCEEERACAWDPQYQRFEDCLAGCGDRQGSCAHKCFQDISANVGIPTNSAFGTCVSRACPSCNLGAPASACGYWTGWSPPSCTDCALASCCDVLKACADSLDCSHHVGCWQDCRDNGHEPACFRTCDAMFPRGIGLNHSYWSCMSSACVTDCFLSGTDVWTCGGLFYADDPCKACSDASCCASATACGGDAGCAQAFVCVRACEGDGPCEAACEASMPGGSSGLLQAFRTCLADSCSC